MYHRKMSTGLFYLNESDFMIKEGPKGNSLCVGIDGYSLILFYSTKCEHCQSLIPIFKKLPSSVGGCTFAMVNVSQNRGVINKAKTTRSPITYVPLIILHINGEPFMRYDGPHEFSKLKRFVIEIAQKVSKNKGSNTSTMQQVAPEVSIPAYTIGRPKNSGPINDVCYLGFDAAYTKLKKRS